MKFKYAELQSAIDEFYAALASEKPELGAGVLAAMFVSAALEGGLSHDDVRQIIERQLQDWPTQRKEEQNALRQALGTKIH